MGRPALAAAPRVAARTRAVLWGLPVYAWAPVGALFCLDNYRVLVGQLSGDDEPTLQINVQIIIHRLADLNPVGAAKVLAQVEDPPLRYLLALPGQALFPHTVWGPRLAALIVSALATWALIQLAREVAGDLAGWTTGLFVTATAIYTVTSLAFGWSLILLGLVQALRHLRGPLDLSLPVGRRGFYRVQLWLAVAFLTSTASLAFVAAAFAIYAWANLRARPRTTARVFAWPIGGYVLYHLVFWVLVPLLGSSVYGKVGRFGQYGHTFSRGGGVAAGLDSFLRNLRGLNGQTLPFVSWALVAAGLVYLWRRERRMLAFVLPHLVLWSFYFGTGTDGYFLLGALLLIPYGIAFAVELAPPRAVLAAAAIIAAAAAAWSTIFFTRTYTPESYPRHSMNAFYADAVFQRNLVQPLAAVAHDLDRVLPPGGRYADDVDHALADFYANHDLANLAYGDPRRAGQLGSAVAPVMLVGSCWQVAPASPQIDVVVTAKRLCPSQVARSISYPDSPIRLYRLAGVSR